MTAAQILGRFIAKSTGPSKRRRSAAVANNAALFFPTSTATTVAAMTGAPLRDITHLRRASGGPARQRQILKGTRWIPSDTSGDVWGRVLPFL